MIEELRSFLKMRIKHITIGTLLLILLVAGFFLYLTLYFYLGDDLILDVTANQTSFHIANIQDATPEVTIETTGQLFCAASCTMTVLTPDGQIIDKEEFNLS